MGRPGRVPSHTYIRTGGRATYLVVVPGIEGPKTVIGLPVERFVQFGLRLVIPRAGTEYYLLKTKRPKLAELLTDPTK